jgi:hypothetical protein
MIYNLIGRAVVKLGWLFLKRKYARRMIALAGFGFVLGITTVGVAGYLATRDVPEA